VKVSMTPRNEATPAYDFQLSQRRRQAIAHQATYVVMEAGQLICDRFKDKDTLSELSTALTVDIKRYQDVRRLKMDPRSWEKNAYNCTSSALIMSMWANMHGHPAWCLLKTEWSKEKGVQVDHAVVAVDETITTTIEAAISNNNSFVEVKNPTFLHYWPYEENEYCGEIMPLPAEHRFDYLHLARVMSVPAFTAFVLSKYKWQRSSKRIAKSKSDENSQFIDDYLAIINYFAQKYHSTSAHT
jgi:hypothetical protein